MTKLPLIFLIILGFTLTTCDNYHCKKCINNVHDMDLPYENGEVITFSNSIDETRTYTAQIEPKYPPEKACGDDHTIQMGCMATNYCFLTPAGSTESFASFENLMIVATIPGEAALSMIVSAYSTTEENGEPVQSLTIGSKTYTDLLHFTNNLSLHYGDCTSFYYSKVDGLVQYEIYTETGMEVWSLHP